VPDILIATDTPHLFEEFRAVLAEPGTTVRWVRSGPDARKMADLDPPDLAVLDLQIGAMGGVAVHLDLRIDQDAGRLERFPNLVVLDRRADTFIARRAGVEGWLLKPLDPIRIRRAVRTLLDGGTFYDTTYLPNPVAVQPASSSI
jgi:DNA-binding response OmpR family regulator